MHTDQLAMRDYHIVAHKGNIDACAQFIYKGYMVSFSTMGLSQGACQTEVRVYGKETPTDIEYEKQINIKLHTVEEAIDFINTL